MANHFTITAKPVSARCNLQCTYCYYSGRQKFNINSRSPNMSVAILEQFIKQYIESQDTNPVYFIWHGGEPVLTGLDFYKQVLRLQMRYANDKKIINCLQTNGTLLNKDFCSFLGRNGFLVGMSIDGPKNLHDSYRKYKNGRSSFAELQKALRLLKQYKIEFNVLTTVNFTNSSYPLDIYHFLKESGCFYFQFLPVVERLLPGSSESDTWLVPPFYKDRTVLAPWSVNPEKYGEFLCTIFDEWRRQDVGRVFIQLFDATLSNWAGENPGLCLFSKTCGNSLVIEYNGDIYSCDHFVYPEYLLGNLSVTHLNALIETEQQKQFGYLKHSGLNKKCMECNYLFACWGECPKNRFVVNGSDEATNYLCKAYYGFFSYAGPYMNFMANEIRNKRSPANVMDL
jgi:uncharacterized protein